VPPEVSWQVTCSFPARPDPEIPWNPDGMFVLATTIADKRVKDDRELLEPTFQAYRQCSDGILKG
jgi:hypothetical protein